MQRDMQRVVAHIIITILAINVCYGYGTERFSVNNGLSQHSVTSIIQDRNDMMWVATFDGLNRFDGLNFKTYRHKPNDKNSLANNRILDLNLDESGRLWILYSNKRVGYYDDATDSFVTYTIPKTIINANFNNDQKYLEIVDNHAIIPMLGTIKIVPLGDIDNSSQSRRIANLQKITSEQADRANSVNQLEVDNDGNIWLATSSGLGVIKDNEGLPYFDMLSREKCLNIKINSDGGMIALFASSLLDITSLQLNKFATNKIVDPNSIKTIEHKLEVTSNTNIAKDSSGSYLMAHHRKVVRLYSNGISNTLLSNETIREVYPDSYGVVWCGGIRGLTSFNPYKQSIYNYKFDPEDFSTDNHVLNLFWDKHQDLLYVAGISNGLEVLSIKREGKEISFHPHKHYLDNVYTSDTYIFPTGELVVSAKRQLLQLSNDKFVAIDSIDTPYNFNKLYGKDDRLWIGGRKIYRAHIDGGELCINPIIDTNRVLPALQVMSMIESIDGNYLWIGYRGGGVFRLDIESGDIRKLNELTDDSIQSDYIWSFHNDSKGNLCIGTDSGLHILKGYNDSYEISTIPSLNNIPSDKIESILEDNIGNLWLSTTQGLICYNPQQDSHIIYNSKDDVQSNTFVSTSCKIDDNYLLFGGINGFSVFNSDNIKHNHQSVKPILEQITQHNTDIALNDNNDYHFKSNQNNISFHVGAFFSPDPQKVIYRYSLDQGGEWIDIRNKRIDFHNLKSGRYSILIQTTTPYCKDNGDNQLEINFVIAAPWWRTLWAIIIYAIIAYIVIYTIIKERVYKGVLRRKLQYESSMREMEHKDIEHKLQFYTNIVHEIKTPLTLIKIPICDILSQDVDNQTRDKLIKIENNVNILTQLTEQILDFRLAVAGKLELNLQEVDLKQTIDNIINNFVDLAQKRSISLEVEYIADNINFYTDPNKLQQILHNLLSNALKFTSTNGVIRVVVKVENDNLILNVADNGVGVDPELRPYIFQRFFKSNESGGSGIGLAFTQKLVTLMGGEIYLDDRVSQGASFIVKIPNIMPASKFNHDDISNGGESILVVEDNIALNNSICEILTAKYRVVQAFNGNDAIEILKNQSVSLIITDVMMPFMDGVTLANRVKSVKSLSHIPILFVTAKSDISEQVYALESGAIDYIIKPFNPQVFSRKVDNILLQYYFSKSHFDASAQQAPKVSVQNSDQLFIGKAQEVVYKNMGNENFGVESLSDELYISRVHLLREFNRILGVSPSEFIRNIRLNYAKELIATGNYSIKEVVWAVGMRSHSGFAKSYKEKFGISPSEELVQIKKTI